MAALEAAEAALGQQLQQEEEEEEEDHGHEREGDGEPAALSKSGRGSGGRGAGPSAPGLRTGGRHAEPEGFEFTPRAGLNLHLGAASRLCPPAPASLGRRSSVLPFSRRGAGPHVFLSASLRLNPRSRPFFLPQT